MKKILRYNINTIFSLIVYQYIVYTSDCQLVGMVYNKVLSNKMDIMRKLESKSRSPQSGKKIVARANLPSKSQQGSPGGQDTQLELCESLTTLSQTGSVRTKRPNSPPESPPPSKVLKTGDDPLPK